MASALLVPIHLDALQLQSPLTVCGPAFDPSQLPYYDGTRDVAPDVPYLSDAVAAPPFESRDVLLQPGVHLHWALPDALTRGSGGQFPPAPDRWLVTRTAPNGVRERWIVESNYVHPPGSAPPPDSIAYPVAPRGPGDPPFRYLGRRVSLSAWAGDTPAASPRPDAYLRGPLTAVGYGDPTFAALYASCRGVFGSWDDAPLDEAGVQYEVVGWHSTPADDPLRRLRVDVLTSTPGASEADLLKAMRDRLGWAADDATALPKSTIYYARLELGALKGVASAHPEVTVGVGNTGTEALVAYLAHAVTTSHKAVVEHQLELAQLGGRLADGADVPARFREARHTKGFTAVEAGVRWAVTAHSTSGSTAADSSAAREQITLPPEAAHLLNEANRLQEAYDRADDLRDALRSQLFADWYKYLLAAHPPGGLDNPLPGADEVRDFLERRTLPSLEAAGAATGVLTLHEDTEGRLTGMTADRRGSLAGRLVDALTALSGAVDALNALPATVASHTTYRLGRAPTPRFWRPNDPVVLITGPETQATLRHGYDGMARPDGLLGCAPFDAPFTDPQRLAADSAALAALGTTLDRLGEEPDRPQGFNDGTGRPWNPIVLEWMVEFFPARPRGTDEPAGAGFAPDHVERTFELPDEAPDLRVLQPELARGANVYVGSAVLTPHAGIQLTRSLDREAARVLKPRLLARFFADQAAASAPVPTAEQNEAGVLTRRLAWNLWASRLTPRLPPLPSTEGGQTPTEAFDAWLLGSADLALTWGVATAEAAARFSSDSGAPADGRAEDDLMSSLDAFLDWYKHQLGEGTQPVVTDLLAAEPLTQVTMRRSSLAALKDDVYLVILRAAMRRLNETPVLAQALGGFNEALLTRHQAFQLPVDDPFAYSDERPFIERVRAAVGSAGSSGPRPLDDFNPVRAGALDVVRLRLIDTFGQVRELTWDRVVAAETLAPQDSRFPAMLPPRLAQPARLSLRWLAADSDEQEMNDHPATSPICGWLLANYLDGSVMAFGADGAALGAVTSSPDEPWQPVPGTDRRPSVEAIPSAALRRVLRSLLGRQRANPAFLERLLRVMEAAQEQIEPDSAAHPTARALLVGRPLAVVRATLGLELQGPPAVHQSWNALRRDMMRAERETLGFEEVRFPVRVGEHGRLNDGVVGFWVEETGDTDSFSRDHLFAPQGGVPDDPFFAGTGLLSGPELGIAPTGGKRTLCLLVDPRGNVHATSGVAPPKSVNIPPDQYTEALRAIEVTFLTAPLLTDRGTVHVSLPDEPGFTWSWLARGDEGWMERAAVGVLARSEVLAAFGGEDGPPLWVALLDAGWLQPLGGTPEGGVTTADTRISVVAPDQRTTSDLGARFAPLVPRVEALLDGTRARPFQPTAAFSAPQELREGWLKLRPAPDAAPDLS